MRSFLRPKGATATRASGPSLFLGFDADNAPVSHELDGHAFVLAPEGSSWMPAAAVPNAARWPARLLCFDPHGKIHDILASSGRLPPGSVQIDPSAASFNLLGDLDPADEMFLMRVLEMAGALARPVAPSSPGTGDVGRLYYFERSRTKRAIDIAISRIRGESKDARAILFENPMGPRVWHEQLVQKGMKDPRLSASPAAKGLARMLETFAEIDVDRSMPVVCLDADERASWLTCPSAMHLLGDAKPSALMHRRDARVFVTIDPEKPESYRAAFTALMNTFHMDSVVGRSHPALVILPYAHLLADLDAYRTNIWSGRAHRAFLMSFSHTTQDMVGAWDAAQTMLALGVRREADVVRVENTFSMLPAGQEMIAGIRDRHGWEARRLRKAKPGEA